MTRSAASDQGLHCLLAGIGYLFEIEQKYKSTPDTPKTGNGPVQLINVGQ